MFCSISTASLNAVQKLNPEESQILTGAFILSVVLWALVFFSVAGFILWLLKKLLRLASDEKEAERAMGKLVRAMAKLYPKSKRPDQQSEYPEPEAHCVVCENTGEDHFQRDKAQRLAQLDEWLKNGVIDKDEYRELKRKYQA